MATERKVVVKDRKGIELPIKFTSLTDARSYIKKKGGRLTCHISP